MTEFGPVRVAAVPAPPVILEHRVVCAIESGAWVISVPQYIRASAFPDDFPLALPEPVPDWKRSDWACDVLPAGDPATG